MSNYKKVLTNELIRILKRSIKRKLHRSEKDIVDIKSIISNIVNYYPNCNECNANIIRLHNYSEPIYEIREDWCIDYSKYDNYNHTQIKGLICRSCNLHKAWNAMEISESPEQEYEPMDVD